MNKEVFSSLTAVMIDDKLTWKQHIDLVKSKLSRNCDIMYRASFLIDRRDMHVLYYSLFFPHNIYCAELWGNSYSTSSKCLLLQEIAILCGAIRMDYTNMLFVTSTFLNY